MQKTKEKPVARLLAEAKAADRKGATAAAQTIYREILTRYPGNRAAKRALSDLSTPHAGSDRETVIALFQRQHYAKALKAASECLEKGDADDTVVLKIQAACCSMLGHPDEALEIYWRLLGEDRNNADLWQKTGSILFDMMRMDDAVDCLELSTKLAPDIVQSWILLARCHHQRGEHVKAYEAISQALGRDSSNSLALIQFAQTLRELGKTEMSEAALDRALASAATAQHRSAAANALGAVKSAMGDQSAARDFFRRALQNDPRNVRAAFNLSRLAEKRPDSKLPDQMRSLLNEPGMTVLEKSQTHFALFTVLDRWDHDSAEAFEHLQDGNRLRRRILRYDPQMQTRRLAFLKTLSKDTPQIQERAPGIRPIFVVGMPRSGTTVTEQMLSAAPGVFAGGEMTVAEALSRTMINAAIQAERKSFSQDELRAFGDGVRTRMTALSRGQPVVIDKMPLNFRWVGLLLAAMPDARVINIRRDPIETCWSNYKVSYASHGNGFAYDLRDLAVYWSHYQELTDHWSHLFPDRFRTIHYETLVATPEPVMRDLIDFCDLEWSDDCLHPEKSDRAILTASEHQVRKPIYNGNKGDWRRYAAYLSPLLDALPNAAA